MYFFYVCPGWEGSANDARVLENAEPSLSALVSSEGESEFGQAQDMREMVLERDRRAMTMWLDYVEYQQRG